MAPRRSRVECWAAAARNSAGDGGAALDYLAFLVPPERLLRSALALYDVPLARLVAARTRQDPKEYLPVLASLEAADEGPRRRHAIDVHLERWPEALVALHESPECSDDALAAFAAAHGGGELFAIAAARRPDSETIARAWALWLETTSRQPAEAAVI